jgi:hypothetical protein|tara:strand:- start:275 stop:481 length:207 start_codon:yes stop_codon:yes gene_type:complete
MSKVKQYYTDLTEKQVDDIILSYKNNKITKQNAIDKIMKLDNLELVGIDEYNIDEVVDDIFYDQKVSA